MERPNIDLAITLLLAMTAETARQTNAAANLTHQIKNACMHDRDLTNHEINVVVQDAANRLHTDPLANVIERLHRALRS